MKKTEIILLTIAVSIAAASCQREAAPGNRDGAGKQITITAGIENDGAMLIDGEEYIPETKTARQEDGKVWWTPGDAISLFFGPNDIMGGNKFLSTAQSPESVTSFTGIVGAATGGGEGVSLDDFSFWAVYPYDKTNVCDGRSVTFAIPTEQESAEGNFGTGQWPTMGHSSGLLLSFNNVVAGYKFMVETEGIIKVVIRTPDTAHPLAGRINVGIDSSGKPVIKSVSEPSNEVVVTPEDGGAFVPGKYYYAAVIHNYFDAGVSFDFYTPTSKATYNCVMTGDKPERPSKRGAFKLMDNKDHGLTWTGYEQPAYVLPDGETFNNHMESLAGSLDNIKWIRFYSGQTNPEDGIRIADDVYMSYVEWGIEVKTSMSKFTANVDCSHMFEGCRKVVTIEGLEKVNTSATTDMSEMFAGCEMLQTVTLTGAFNTGNVTTMFDMFYDCNEIEKLDLSHFNIRRLKIMSFMFEFCYFLEEVYLGKNFVIPDDCVQDETILGCDATFYGTTEEMESFVRNLGSGANGNYGKWQFAIDMGEAGWWSAWNVGADKPEEYGDYYAWGVTDSELTWMYDWTEYPDNPSGDGKKFIKYYTWPEGGKRVLDPVDDVAHLKWGGKWRMPTMEECRILRDNVSSTWTTDYKGTGVAGRIVTSSNGNSIFLPAASSWSEGMWMDSHEQGLYWSSSLSPDFSYDSWAIEINPTFGILVNLWYRCRGLPVRPISD